MPKQGAKVDPQTPYFHYSIYALKVITDIMSGVDEEASHYTVPHLYSNIKPNHLLSYF